MSRSVSSLVEDQINKIQVKIPVNNKVDEIHHEELFFSYFDENHP